MNTTLQQEQMPEKIYVTPTGSGTVSGVWVDMKMDDEERGEYEYIKAESVEKMKALLQEATHYLRADQHFDFEKKIQEALTAAKL